MYIIKKELKNMIIRNNCVEEGTINIELNGVCSSITEIINQAPTIECDELMVCIGPHLVSLYDLITDVYTFVQSSQQSNDVNFQNLFNQYNLLYFYFLKCCKDLTDRLIRIERRINNIVVVREVYIKSPSQINNNNNNNNNRPAQKVSIQPPPFIINEDRYVIDQSIMNGYTEGYKVYFDFGYSVSPYVFWLMNSEGFLRKLCIKEVPFIKGSLLANNWINEVIKIFNENQIEFDASVLVYKKNIVKYSFIIPKLSGRFLVSNSSLISLDGVDVNSFLPIIYNKKEGDLLLEKITKYRIDKKPLLIGHEPVLFTYQVLNSKTGVRTLFEAGVNHWIKYTS